MNCESQFHNNFFRLLSWRFIFTNVSSFCALHHFRLPCEKHRDHLLILSRMLIRSFIHSRHVAFYVVGDEKMSWKLSMKNRITIWLRHHLLLGWKNWKKWQKSRRLFSSSLLMKPPCIGKVMEISSQRFSFPRPLQILSCRLSPFFSSAILPLRPARKYVYILFIFHDDLFIRAKNLIFLTTELVMATS